MMTNTKKWLLDLVSLKWNRGVVFTNQKKYRKST